MKHNIFQKATEYKHLGKQKKRWHRAVNGMAAVVVFVTTYALILPAITMERETICGLDGQDDHVHTEVCYAPEDELLIEETVSRENMILKCLPETMVHTHTEECLDENGENICGYADFVVHTHNSDCYKDDELVCLLTEVAPHVHDESCYVAELTEIPTVSSNEAELTEIPTVSGNEAESTEAVAVIDVETEEATAETESAEFEGELVCTLEEIQLHQHEEGCFDENGRWICGQVEVMEHIHDDDCFHYLTQTFTYSDNEIEATVEVVTETGIPTDTQMIFRVMDYGSEDFAVYADYAVENVDGELTALNAYEIKFISEDQELELPDAQISVQITVKEITEPEAQLMTLGLEDEGTESTEDNSSTIQLTALQQQEEGVSSGEPLNVNGEETLTVTLSLGSSRSFALATSSVEQPEFTIQYYAHVDHFKQASENSDVDDAFWIINTNNSDVDYDTAASNSDKGYLPENGQYVLDNNNSPVPENNLLCLEKTETIETINGVEKTVWSFTQEKLITKIYKDKSAQKYWENMTVNDLDNLRDNTHYTLTHIITQNDEQRANMENGGLEQSFYSDQYSEDTWKAWNGWGETTEGSEAYSDEYWTIYHLEDASYVLTTDEEEYNASLNTTKDRILITDGMTVRLGYETITEKEEYSAAFFDYDISDGKIYALNETTGGADANATINKFNSRDTDVYGDTMLLFTQQDGVAKGINSPDNYATNDLTEGTYIKYAFGNGNTYTGLGDESAEVTVVSDDETINGTTTKLMINRESGLVGETWDTQVYTYSFLGCSFGIVDSYDYSNKTLGYANIGGKQIVAPDLFSLQATTGKTVYADSKLGFTREGDTYTLTSAKVNGTLQNGTSETGTVENLDEFIVRPSYLENVKVISNDFWPLDDFITDDTTGHDFKFKAKDADMESLQINNGVVTTNPLPTSDGGYAHNNYFGMNFSIDFELDGNYVGPLEYLFYGDDDLWVFLTDVSTNTSQLVCDIGGVHGSVGEYTDLWDWIPKKEDGSYKEGKYALTVFYTERGATGSSCYMQFTLPNAISESVEPATSGSLKITKEVAESDVVGSEEAKNKLYNFGINLPVGKYPYAIYDTAGEYVSSGTFSVSEADVSSSFSLLMGQSITIRQIPIGSDFTVWEEDGENYDMSWSVPQGVTTQENRCTGKISSSEELALTCTNDLLGSLTLTKRLEGVTVTDTEFNFEILLTDASDTSTEDKTYPVIKLTESAETGEMVETEGSIPFESTGDGTTRKANVNLKADESIAIKELPAGSKLTITELNTDGYIVSNTVGEVTTNSVTIDGTVIFGDNNSVTFINKTSYMLPNTGGMGTNLYTIGGLMLMFGSICFMYKNLMRRKEEGL